MKRSIVGSYSRLISIPLENFPVPGWWPTWLSILVEIWKIMKIMIFKPPWLPKHGFSARSATLPRNVKILTRRAFSLRVIRRQGGASWHFEKDLTFCNLGGSFLRILENPWIHFGREHFSPVKHQKIYRLILLPSHFYSSGEFPSSGLVTNLAGHFGGNLKSHENHDFQAARLPKHGFTARSATLPRNVKVVTRRALLSKSNSGSGWS